MFEMIDNFLMDSFFEPIQRKFQKLTGKTCFWLAKIFFLITAVSQSVLILDYLHEVIVFSITPLTLQILIIIIPFLLILTCEKNEREFMENSLKAENYMNKMRIKMSKTRGLIFTGFLFVFWLPLISPQFRDGLDLFGVLQIVLSITYFLGICFMACTPLPPGTSKMEQWYQSALKKIYQALEPRGEMVPAKS